MRIDLNADLGESVGHWREADDLALLDVVTSANVACGFHAGDRDTMRRVCAAAVERGVAIGAHVSYPDREGFGRRPMDRAPGDVAADVAEQLDLLGSICRAEGAHLRYVKPHGALYHAVTRDGGRRLRS